MRNFNKYRAIKTLYKDEWYDSKLEANCAMELDLLQRAGQIVEYKRQVKIDLIAWEKKICMYKIDFVVLHNDGHSEYLEAKGMVTRDWKLKWKLLEAQLAHTDANATMSLYVKARQN